MNESGQWCQGQWWRVEKGHQGAVGKVNVSSLGRVEDGGKLWVMEIVQAELEEMERVSVPMEGSVRQLSPPRTWRGNGQIERKSEIRRNKNVKKVEERNTQEKR